MKKLFRQEWKYYLVFLIAMLCWLCLNSVMFREHFDITSSKADSALTNIWWFITYMDLWIGNGYVYDLTTAVLRPMLVSILLLKGGIFWIEKDSYGRDFFQTLPVKRVDRMQFHLLMDSMFIVFTLVIYGFILYLYARHEFTMVELELPWFGKSVAGLIITDISYLLFLLGIINFLECLFVNGAIRFFGIISCMGMFSYIVNQLFTMNVSNNLMQKLFGFLFLQSAGNRTFSAEWAWNRVAAPWLWDFVGGWTHASLTPEIIYQGKPLEYTLENTVGGVSYISETDMFSTLYDFSKIGSYGWYVLAYAVLAVIFVALSIRLFGKQELSKEGLYFSFAKYLFSVLICGAFYLFLNVDSGKIWHALLSVAATVILFIILVILMTPDRRKPFFAKAER